MKAPTLFAALIAALTTPATHADNALEKRTPTEVVNHHIAAMLKHDPATLVEDYADDAVVVLEGRVFNGKQQVKQLFGFGEPAKPAKDDHAQFNVASVDGDVVIEAWSHDGTNGDRVSGADIIVVRNGKIAFHTTQSTSPVNAAK